MQTPPPPAPLPKRPLLPGVLLLLASAVMLPVFVLSVSALDSGSAGAFTGVGRVMLYAAAILGGATPAIFGVVHLCLRAWLEREDTRLRHGRCQRCGYDLRANPERCPECGAFKVRPSNAREN